LAFPLPRKRSKNRNSEPRQGKGQKIVGETRDLNGYQQTCFERRAAQEHDNQITVNKRGTAAGEKMRGGGKSAEFENHRRRNDAADGEAPDNLTAAPAGFWEMDMGDGEEGRR